MDKIINQEAAKLGLGIFASGFVGAKLTTLAEGVPQISAYAKEVVGAGMLVVGSALIGKRETRYIGTVIAATGASKLAATIADRVGGTSTPAAVTQTNGNANGGLDYSGIDRLRERYVTNYPGLTYDGRW